MEQLTYGRGSKILRQVVKMWHPGNKSEKAQAARGRGQWEAMDKVLLERVQKQGSVLNFRRYGPLILFLLISAGTLISVGGLEKAEAERLQTELDGHATEIAAALERRATEHIAILHAAAAVFSLDDDVEPEEFTALAGGMRRSGAYHGSMGLAWAEVVPLAQVSALEKKMQGTGAEPYRVYPHPTASTVISVPVIFIDPMTASNQAGIGYDMYSDPMRRQAMDAAVRSGQPQASGKVELIRGNGPGFLIFMPVFNEESDGEQLKGFVLSPFRAPDFLAAAAELYSARDIQVSLYDGGKTGGGLLVGPALGMGDGASVDRKIEIAGRPWILSVAMEPGPALSELSRVTLIFGLILAVLAAALARVITNRAMEDRLVLEWLSRQSAIRTSLIRELNHRVKNTLANVLSIVSLTRRQATNIDEFTESLTGRLKALSATHDLLSQSDWRAASIQELVRAELAPYLDEDEGRIAMDGVEISLAPNEALSLGLAIHELATNAAKYGALSTAQGRVSVSWTLISPDVAEVLWEERNGPPVQPPTRRGFGIELIERIVAQELNSKVQLEFLPGGVRCRMRVPLRQPSDFNLRGGGKTDPVS